MIDYHTKAYGAITPDKVNGGLENLFRKNFGPLFQIFRMFRPDIESSKYGFLSSSVLDTAISNSTQEKFKELYKEAEAARVKAEEAEKNGDLDKQRDYLAQQKAALVKAAVAIVKADTVLYESGNTVAVFVDRKATAGQLEEGDVIYDEEAKIFRRVVSKKSDGRVVTVKSGFPAPSR